MIRPNLVLAPLLAGALTIGCQPAASGGGDEKANAAPYDAPKASEAAAKKVKDEGGTSADPAAKAPADDAYAAPEDVAAPPEDAKKTDSGLAYTVIKSGDGGDKPGPQDVVTVHYTGWTTDGKMFDSSRKRGKKSSFPLNRVIAGWTEGLQLMSPGDQFRFWIPEDLAYKGMPGRPAGMLVFDVELFEIQQTPKTPDNVGQAPKDAKTTKSGLAYVVLKKGEGERRPKATSKVKVHYSGWTTDGKMFDSSVLRGRPATFPLTSVIPGWTEGLQLMTPGAKFRFWIPGDLAYDGQPGRPQGTLVFDVELLEIQG